MKTVIHRLGFLAKFGLIAGLLVSGQHVLAQESTPGTPVTNTATVTFSVGTVSQDPVLSNPETFWVDRRVNFELTTEEVQLEEVAPGQDEVFVSFLVTNTSNGPLDFVTNALSIATGTVRGETITAELTDYTVEVAAAVVTPGNAPAETPVLGANNVRVVNLDVGEQIRIHVYGNVPPTLVDNDIAAVDLSLTAAEAGNGPQLEETAGADNKLAIDNVFANTSGADGSGNATETLREGFRVLGADVEAEKNGVTIDDGLGNTDPLTAKPIPGATVEYTITVTNNGSQVATGVVVTDTLDPALVTLVGGATGSANGVACTVADTDPGDSCSYDAGTNTVSIQLGDIPGSGGTGTATFLVTVL